MTDLSADFQRGRIISIGLSVPTLAMQALHCMAEITGARDICIAGGFVRGLYMQQVLGLAPQMNDIDVFADISHEEFNSVEGRLRTEFGHPIRFHVGRFEKEESLRGLQEFALPETVRKNCAGVESLQLNFGADHPFANVFHYLALANVGMNQIAVDMGGNIIASPLFMTDMDNKTMTMNPGRVWTTYDWFRTMQSLERMQKERPEFQGWKIIQTPKPNVPGGGVFWNVQAPLFPEPFV